VLPLTASESRVCLQAREPHDHGSRLQRMPLRIEPSEDAVACIRVHLAVDRHEVSELAQ
jgi:hypothetical protein